MTTENAVVGQQSMTAPAWDRPTIWMIMVQSMLATIDFHQSRHMEVTSCLKLLEDHGRSWSIESGKSVDSFFKDVKLKSGRIPNHVAINSPALDTVTVTGAITTVWVLLVTTKHPQSNAHAQLNSSPLNMTFQEKIGLLTWTRTQRLSWTKWLWPILAIQLI